jgi:hypothetical protein
MKTNCTKSSELQRSAEEVLRNDLRMMRWRLKIDQGQRVKIVIPPRIAVPYGYR